MTARKTAIRFGVHANGVLEEITQNITGNEKRKSKHDTNFATRRRSRTQPISTLPLRQELRTATRSPRFWAD
jgi:hypothetical protein